VAELESPLETADPQRDPVIAQVARLLRSGTFANAPSLRRLLAYVVDRSLDGTGDAVKEYSIGVEVFDRGESFDPRIDTIVRVQARRLRAKLVEYYALEGRADPIVIELPKGRYLPRFRSVPVSDLRDLSGPRSEQSWRRSTDYQRAEPASARQASSLPVPRTTLIGRESEVAHLRRLIGREDTRLVTMTGAGGSGKTRLALHVASDVAAAFPGGVHFVGLGSVADVNDVGSMVAQAFGLHRIDSGSVDAALREHVRCRLHERTLLVLDNFEQLLPAAPLLVAMLESSAALTIMVTSRTVLHVLGEQCFHVPPLPVPDLAALPPIQTLAENPAVALFVQRAAAVQQSFALTTENASAIAEICARVDGLPLAIELAAARTGILSPVQIRARLESRFDVLAGGGCDLPVRQQTLRKTIDWSHELLGQPERRLFRRLAVFAGSCTVEGAEAVCNARRDLDVDALEGMSSLVDRSLIQQVDAGHGELRFAMLATVREYALEQLDALGERAATQRAHAAYCIVLAEEGFAQATATGRTEWLERCHSEHDNHRAALDYLIETGDSAWALRLALALFEYWDRREHRLEGHARLEAILSLPDMASPTKARATAVAFASLLAPVFEAVRRAEEALAIYRQLGDLRGVVGQLNNLGVNRRFLGDYDGARYWLEQSVSTCRELGDRAAIALALSNLADVESRLGARERARTLLLEALALFREIEHPVGQAWSLNHLGDLARASGQRAEAREHYQQGADRFRSLGDQRGVARSAIDLGHLACEEGDLAAAHALFMDALNAFAASDHKLGVAIALEAFAYAAAQQGQYDRAFTLAGAASGVRQTVGSTASAGADQDVSVDRRLAGMMSRDDARLRSKWIEGSAMPVERAIEYARTGLDVSTPERS
jgi:predicted ATPase